MLFGYLAYSAVVWLVPGGVARPLDGGGAQFFARLTAILGVGLTIVGAVAVSTLRRLDRFSLGTVLLTGVLIGNVPFGFFVGLAASATLGHLAAGTMGEHLAPVSSLVAGTLRALLLGSSVGAASAALFWLVAVVGSDSSDAGESRTG